MFTTLFAAGCGASRPTGTALDADIGDDAEDASARSDVDHFDAGSSTRPSDAGTESCTRDCGQQLVDAASDSGSTPDDATRPASCRGLADTCGPKGNENCCASLVVPGGTFWLGRRAGDPDDVCDTSGGATCFANETPAVQATVRTFQLDRFEVSVGRFRKFVEAKAPSPTAGSGKHGYLNNGNEPGWDVSWLTSSGSNWDDQLSTCTEFGYGTWTSTAGANESKAINCVPWSDAYAFCIWDGGFLPTEAEWEYAASGGEERLYPSGQRLGNACFGTSCLHVRAVGLYAADDGKWGHADLAGNVFEWVLDTSGPYPARCDDCANLTVDEYMSRVARGGAASQPERDERAVAREMTTGNISGPYGVRCARRAE
ncbi:MAG: hypothetical protein JWN48_2952 [Myxococcaceae bacterium]|nr:hypothetical protein [Myxococcaceae bacterium]